MANVKKAILQKKIEGELYDLLVKTSAEQVVMADGETTLAEHLATMTLEGYATTAQMQQAIDDAIDALVDGAPEAFDTLKELADWIASHQDLYEGLVTNLAGKVDKEDGKGLSSEDFTAALKSKLEGLSNYDETQLKNELNGHLTDNAVHVTSEEKTKIAESSRVLVGTTTPADLTERDLFIQIIE